MNWLKENWDKASLLVISGLVVACSVMVLLNNSSFKDRFQYSPVVGDARKREIDDTKISDIEAAKGTYQAKVNWNNAKVSNKSDVPLFRSVILLQKGREVIDMMAGTPLRPPLTNEFLLEYGLDYTRTDVRERDEDDDGFSNLEEFQGVNGKSTNPIDPKDHPPLTAKLYLKNRIEIPYSLELVSKSVDIYTLRADEDGKVDRKLVRVGEVFVDRFTIVPGSFVTKEIEDEKLGIKRKVDFVKVLDAKSGQELELREKVPYPLPTYQGELLFGLKVDSDLIVDQQGHFGIDEAGRIHPAGMGGGRPEPGGHPPVPVLQFG